MKKIQYIQSLLLVGIVLFYGSGKLYPQQSKQLNLLVLEFAKDTASEDKQNTLDVTSRLKKELGAMQGINVLTTGNYNSIDLSYPSNEGLSQDLEGVDYVIDGYYQIDQKSIKIQPVFYSVQDKFFHRIGYSGGKLKWFETLVGVVADNIYSKIIEMNPSIQQTVKTIAVFYDYEIYKSRMKESDIVNRKAQDTTHRIILGLMDSENAALIPWKDIRKAGSNKAFADVQPRVTADAYILLHYGFSSAKELVSVTPTFRTVDGYVLELPEIRDDYYENVNFIDFVINDLKDFLNTIITDVGKWDNQYLRNQRVPDDMLIRRARGYSVSREYYFSNYYYYKALAALPEEENDIRIQLGFNKIYEYRLLEANEEFEYVLRKEPENTTALYGKALVKYYQSNYNSALITLEEARNKGLEDNFLYYSLTGLIYFDSGGQFAEALESFQKASQSELSDLSYKYINLNQDDVNYQIGICYLELSKYDEAIEHYLNLFREDPENGDVRFYLSNSYAVKGIEAFEKEAYDEAVNLFSSARKYYKNPELNDLFRNALINTRKFNEADELITTEIASGNYDPTNIYLTHGLDIRRLMIDLSYESGSQGFDQSLGEQVISNLNKSLEYNLEDPITYFYLGNTYVLMGNFEEGESYLEMAFNLEKSNLDLQLNLMRVYLISNQYSKCEDFYDQIGNINKKKGLSQRFKALMDFMMVSAYYAQGLKPTGGLDKKLTKLLKKDFVIDYWSFDNYITWLNQCNCSADAKMSLEDLTNMMKTKAL